MDIVKRLKQEFSGNALKDIADQTRSYVKERHEAADEIERLREQVAAMQKYHPTNIDYFLHNGVRIEYDLNMLVVFKVEGPK